MDEHAQDGRENDKDDVMKALQYVEVGKPPVIREVPTPEPGPGQVRLKATAAGACHSDSFVMSLSDEDYRASYPLPMTLGHEGAGIVYSPRFLVPLGDLDPADNVALTDAGLTPHHAIKGSLSKLVPGSTAVVIGTGGLGHVAIQILRELTPATVIALDVADEKLALAKEVGAHHAFLSNPDAVDAIREATGSATVTAIFDFVGIQPTADLGAKLSGTETDQVLVGVGATKADVGVLGRAYDATVRAPYWGSRSELMEVLNLARAGRVDVETERFSLDDAPEAYRRLHEGTLRGRAVVTP